MTQETTGNYAAQAAADSCQGRQISVEEAWAKSILERIDRADKMYPAGSYEHAKTLGAALVSAWPQIRGLLMRYPRS